MLNDKSIVLIDDTDFHHFQQSLLNAILQHRRVIVSIMALFLICLMTLGKLKTAPSKWRNKCDSIFSAYQPEG